MHYGFMHGSYDRSYEVSLFRHLRIMAYLQLPGAFRSLSRLSSALGAKASTLRSFLLDQFSDSRCIALHLCFKSISLLPDSRLKDLFGFYSDVLAFLDRNTKHCIRYLILYELSHLAEVLRWKLASIRSNFRLMIER